MAKLLAVEVDRECFGAEARECFTNGYVHFLMMGGYVREISDLRESVLRAPQELYSPRPCRYFPIADHLNEPSEVQGRCRKIAADLNKKLSTSYQWTLAGRTNRNAKACEGLPNMKLP